MNEPTNPTRARSRLFRRLLAAGVVIAAVGAVGWLFEFSGRVSSPPVPTPPAVAAPDELKGWQLDDTNTGLASVGLSCDALPLYTGSDKPDSGTVITEQRIETVLDLSNGGITIERSCVRPVNVSRGLPLVTTTDVNKCNDQGCPSTPTMVTLRDCEIDGSRADNRTVAYSLGFGGIGTIENCNIHDVGSGIGIANAGDHLDAVIKNNYVHRLRAWGNSSTEGSHNDGITIRDFTTAGQPNRQATVVGNRVDVTSGNDTGAVFIQPNNGPIDHVLIEGNLLEGNGYQLGLERANGFDYGRSMRALDNRFSGTDFGPGYVDAKGLTYGWAAWSDNFIADRGQQDYRGRPIAPPRL